MDLPKTFGRRLTAVLHMLGVSQIQFAQDIGVSRATINRVCCGRMPPTVLLANACKGALSPEHWEYCAGLTDKLKPENQA